MTPSPTVELKSFSVHSRDRQDSVQSKGGHNPINQLIPADLQRLNEKHKETTSLERWEGEDRRDEPWNAVGRVRSIEVDPTENDG